jgi:antitoxin ParD1/3/4
MPTRNVVLTDHHEKIVATLVSSGRYQNASEVLREGLRLVEAREAREAAKLNALREAAQFGCADLDAGRYREFGYDELESVIEALGQQASDQVRNSLVRQCGDFGSGRRHKPTSLPCWPAPA